MLGIMRPTGAPPSLSPSSVDANFAALALPFAAWLFLLSQHGGNAGVR